LLVSEMPVSIPRSRTVMTKNQSLKSEFIQEIPGHNLLMYWPTMDPSQDTSLVCMWFDTCVWLYVVCIEKTATRLICPYACCLVNCNVFMMTPLIAENLEALDCFQNRKVHMVARIYLRFCLSRAGISSHYPKTRAHFWAVPGAICCAAILR
jgi:hypothetical protein